MARSPIQRALQAANALEVYLRDRQSPAFGSAEGEVIQPADRATVPNPWHGQAVFVRQQPAILEGGTNKTLLRLPHPDWLQHQLIVTGPSAELGRFRDAAAGAGTVPWQLDFGRMEEDLFHVLVAAGQLSLAGARVLSGQLQAAVARRHARAVVRVGRSVACPFDLHALVPVPDAILCLGPDHPEALAWLWAHWGTTEAVRHVTDRAGAGRNMSGAPAAGALKLRFWSADWTPWRALEKIRADWPGLWFDVRPDYGTA